MDAFTNKLNKLQRSRRSTNFDPRQLQQMRDDNSDKTESSEERFTHQNRRRGRTKNIEQTGFGLSSEDEEEKQDTVDMLFDRFKSQNKPVKPKNDIFKQLCPESMYVKGSLTCYVCNKSLKYNFVTKKNCEFCGNIICKKHIKHYRKDPQKPDANKWHKICLNCVEAYFRKESENKHKVKDDKLSNTKRAMKKQVDRLVKQVRKKEIQYNLIKKQYQKEQNKFKHQITKLNTQKGKIIKVSNDIQQFNDETHKKQVILSEKEVEKQTILEIRKAKYEDMQTSMTDYSSKIEDLDEKVKNIKLELKRMKELQEERYHLKRQQLKLQQEEKRQKELLHKKHETLLKQQRIQENSLQQDQEQMQRKHEAEMKLQRLNQEKEMAKMKQITLEQEERIKEQEMLKEQLEEKLQLTSGRKQSGEDLNPTDQDTLMLSSLQRQKKIERVRRNTIEQKRLTLERESLLQKMIEEEERKIKEIEIEREMNRSRRADSIVNGDPSLYLEPTKYNEVYMRTRSTEVPGGNDEPQQEQRSQRQPSHYQQNALIQPNLDHINDIEEEVYIEKRQVCKCRIF